MNKKNKPSKKAKPVKKSVKPKKAKKKEPPPPPNIAFVDEYPYYEDEGPWA